MVDHEECAGSGEGAGVSQEVCEWRSVGWGVGGEFVGGKDDDHDAAGWGGWGWECGEAGD